MKHFLKKKVVVCIALLLVIQCPIVRPSSLGTIKSIPDSKIQNSTPKQILTDSIYDYAEVPAKFPGGDKEMYSYLSSQIKYPAESTARNEQGKVVVQFVVSKSGEVMMPKVIKGVTPLLDNEALRVVNSMPAFIPAEHEGKKVSFRLVLPIAFKLNNVSTDESNWRVTDKTVVVIDGMIKPEIKAKMINPTFVGNLTIKKPFPEAEKSKLMQDYGSQAENGVVLITTKKLNRFRILPMDERIDADSVRDCLFERPCLYPGGENEIYSFINKTIKYPSVALDNRVQGKVVVGFTVNKSGERSSIKVIESVDPALDKEALRVVSLIPDTFIPGTYRDEKIDVKYVLPVSFKLEGEKPSKQIRVKHKAITEKINDEDVYDDTDCEAGIIGGEDRIYSIFKENQVSISVSDTSNIKVGTVVLKCIIDKNGRVLHPKIISSVSDTLDKEALRLLTKLPDFCPAKNFTEAKDQDIKPVNSTIILPIGFVSDKTQKAISQTPFNASKIDISDTNIYKCGETQPQFPEGELKLMDFLAQNVRYPEMDLRRHVQGKVVIQFVVNKSGKVTEPKVVRSVSPTTDAEAIRVINLLPDFIPGRINGEPVSVSYTLPISFKLAE